jgi:tetratricopeptide (TPR) repeat protein
VTRAQIAGLAAVAGLAFAGATRSPGLWGVHASGFLPAPVRFLVFGLAAGAILLAPRAARLPAARVGPAAAACGLLVLAILLWLLRERAFFLGDAKAMLGLYEAGRVRLDGHALLTTLVNFNLYRALRSIAPVGPESVVAATSVGAGIVFSWLALGLTARRVDALGDPWVARALLLTCGAMALFSGYVENYSLLPPIVLLYLGAGLDTAAGRGGLGRPFALLLLAMGFHFAAFTLIPSFAVIALRRAAPGGASDAPARPGARRRPPAARIALVAAAVGAALALTRFSRDATLEAGGIGRHILFLGGDPFYRAYGFLSGDHLVDVANALLLLLPAGMPLLLAVLIRAGASRAARAAARALAEPAGRFLAAAVAGGLAFLLVFVAEIGVARDWDLFAFAAIPTALLAARLASRAPGEVRAGAVVVAAVQLANTLPFVLVNADPAATLARARALLADERRLSPHALSYGAAYVAPALGREGRWAEALPYYETVVRHRPREAAAQLGLGAALLRLGRGDEGVAAMERSLTLDPNDRRGWSLLGSYFFQRARYAEAEAPLRRALAIDAGDADDLATLGMVLANLERFAEAQEALEAALAREPRRADARLHLGFVHGRLGRPLEARRLLESLLDDPRAGAPARELLARLEADSGGAAAPPPRAPGREP